MKVRGPWMRAITTVVPMPRMLLSLRTERTVAGLASRMALRTRRAGGGRPASSPAGARNDAGIVGSLRGSLPEMCLSIGSTARRDATSPAVCPPMPSATMSRVWSSEMAKESSLDLRRRPTSDRPALSVDRRAEPSPPAALPLDTRPLFLLPGRQQLVQPGDRRLVVRLERQNAPQLLDRLLLVPGLRQGEGQVETGERILRIGQERLAKSGDRLVPALQLSQGDADVVVDVGEIGIEQAGLAKVRHGAPVAIDRLQAQPEARVEGSHPEVDVGIVGRQRQRVTVSLDRGLQVVLLLRLLGGGDVGLGQIVDRQPAVGFRRLRGLQHAGQELDRLLRFAAVVVG